MRRVLSIGTSGEAPTIMTLTSGRHPKLSSMNPSGQGRLEYRINPPLARFRNDRMAAPPTIIEEHQRGNPLSGPSYRMLRAATSETIILRSHLSSLFAKVFVYSLLSISEDFLIVQSCLAIRVKTPLMNHVGSQSVVGRILLLDFDFQLISPVEVSRACER